VSDVPSDLTCTICLSAFRKPVQCDGGHVYCQECITPISSSLKGRCPIGGQQCKISKLLIVSAIVRNALHALHVKCPLLCGEWTGAFETLEQHVKCCTNRTVQCVGCKVTFQFNNLKSHESNCSNKLVKCEYCGLMNAMAHTNYCGSNPHRLVMCSCRYEVKFSELETHISSNITSHFIILSNRINALSQFTFNWKFTLKPGETVVRSNDVIFGGICWYVYVLRMNPPIIHDDFGVYLRVKEYESNVTFMQCVKFEFTVDGSGVRKCTNAITFNNLGLFQDKTTKIWESSGYGFNNVYSFQTGVEYKIRCTIKFVN
jgi:hypothetical protein